MEISLVLLQATNRKACTIYDLAQFLTFQSNLFADTRNFIKQDTSDNVREAAIATNNSNILKLALAGMHLSANINHTVAIALAIVTELKDY